MLCVSLASAQVTTQFSGTIYTHANVTFCLSSFLFLMLIFVIHNSSSMWWLQWESDSMINFRTGRLNLVDLAGSERYSCVVYHIF